ADKLEGVELKKAEKVMIDNADRQATARTALDEIAARLAEVVRNGAAENKADAKAAAAAKAAAKAVPDLDAGSHDMAEAADTLRQGSPFANKTSLSKGSTLQLSAADKIAKARAALKETAMDLGKERKDDHAKTSGKQEQTHTKAGALKAKLASLGEQIDKAHAAASGKLEAKPSADATGAAGKMGEAAEHMGKAKDDLKKPDPASAARGENKAIAAMQAALDKVKDLERKVDELKDPARRLERIQKEV